MKIFEKSDSIIFYSLNTKYFDKFSKVSCQEDGSSHWRATALNTNTFVYDLNFYAKDEASGEHFIQYRSKMLCKVTIEDEKKDSLEMLNLIKDFHAAKNLFIRNNSLSFYSKLDLPEYRITEMGVTKMEAGLTRLKDMTPYEDKSEIEIMEEEEIEDIEIEVKVTKLRL